MKIKPFMLLNVDGISGIQLRSESNQKNDDDTAANNIRAKCSDGTILTGDGHSWGSWDGWRYCDPGEAVCAMKTKVEPNQGSRSDDSGLNTAHICCCKV